MVRHACRATMLAMLAALLSAPGQGTPAAEQVAVVRGTVVVDGETPEPKQWELDKVMQKHLGVNSYQEETWLVGKNRGLANCVITLHAKAPATTPVVKPREGAVLDKVGVRYVPRVLVVTPGTQVTFRNKESPCNGFQYSGNLRLGNNDNCLVGAGKEHRVKLRGPDMFRVTCPVRPYATGYIHIVDTPFHAVTDGDSKFVIRDVPPGSYRVTVWHEAMGKLPPEAGPVEVVVAEPREYPLSFTPKAPKQDKK